MTIEQSGLAHLSWLAVYVKHRHEKTVSSAFRGKGYEEFLPLYARHSRSRTTELPLIPGYVFCKFDGGRSLPILTVPGVLGIVTVGRAPAVIPEDEIAALRKIAGSGLQSYPWPTLAIGRKVLIHSGPLRGVQGVLQQLKDSGRLVVSITLLQRSVAVDIDCRMVEPLPEWIAACA